MRRYDEPVEVRTALRAEEVGAEPAGPEEFLWQGRLWRVRATVARWVETGPWWTTPGVRAVVGPDDDSDDPSEVAVLRAAAASRHPARGVAVLERDLLVRPRARADVPPEREVWRVEAECAREVRVLREPADAGPPERAAIVDLVFSWTTGSWRLTACLD